MQVKQNENRAAVEHDKDVTKPQKIDPVAESNKTHDVRKQAEEQQDKGENWKKFAANKSGQSPANVNQQAHVKQVEANEEIKRADIEARLREDRIKA